MGNIPLDNADLPWWALQAAAFVWLILSVYQRVKQTLRDEDWKDWEHQRRKEESGTHDGVPEP